METKRANKVKSKKPHLHINRSNGFFYSFHKSNFNAIKIEYCY
jgi:hypothetical protein